jgi:hypothetical protein
MPTFQPLDSFAPRQQFKNLTELVLCCIILFEPLMMIPCGPQHVRALKMNIIIKVSMEQTCAIFGLVSFNCHQ